MYYLIKLEITSLKCEKDFFLTSLDEIDLLIYKEFNESVNANNADMKRGKPLSESMNSKQRNIQKTPPDNATKQTLTTPASTQPHMDVFTAFLSNA